MGAVYFYHLTRQSLERTLPMLLEKARGAGWRVLVRGTDKARLDWLDEKLWLGPEEGFLAHGRAGGPHDAQQPVLLTEANGAAVNEAQCLMSVDGAEVTSDEVG
ncbi:MAG: DNA polymerase III subunit chi, partial [Pseudomonadota bacterium]